MMKSMRARVCGAILRDDHILMVHHRDASREYWTLPGGGIEAGETPEEAVVREVREETGLAARVVRFLYEETYGHDNSTCRCYWLEVDEEQEAVLGYDPEETHLAAPERLLQGVAWHTLDSMQEDGQVSQVIRYLNLR
jgi:8-oxo-dGTP diphosphatase